MTDAPQKPTWDELKQLLRWFAAAFGQPSELLDDEVVPRALGLAIRAWLGALEAFARALLVLMAAELPRPAPIRTQTPAATRKEPSTDHTGESAAASVFDLHSPMEDDDPSEPCDPESERWAGVAFPLLPPKQSRGGEWHADNGVRRSLSTRRLAFRLEALIRVAEKPERYAALMARRLAAKPKLAFRVLRIPRPPDANSAPQDDVGRAIGFAWFAAERFGLDTG